MTVGDGKVTSPSPGGSRARTHAGAHAREEYITLKRHSHIRVITMSDRPITIRYR